MHVSSSIVTVSQLRGFPPKEALDYLCGLQSVQSILFGASSEQNICQTSDLVLHYSSVPREATVLGS